MKLEKGLRRTKQKVLFFSISVLDLQSKLAPVSLPPWKETVVVAGVCSHSLPACLPTNIPVSPFATQEISLIMCFSSHSMNISVALFILPLITVLHKSLNRWEKWETSANFKTTNSDILILNKRNVSTIRERAIKPNFIWPLINATAGGHSWFTRAVFTERHLVFLSRLGRWLKGLRHALLWLAVSWSNFMALRATFDTTSCHSCAKTNQHTSNWE